MNGKEAAMEELAGYFRSLGPFGGAVPFLCRTTGQAVRLTLSLRPWGNIVRVEDHRGNTGVLVADFLRVERGTLVYDNPVRGAVYPRLEYIPAATH